MKTKKNHIVVFKVSNLRHKDSQQILLELSCTRAEIAFCLIGGDRDRTASDCQLLTLFSPVLSTSYAPSF